MSGRKRGRRLADEVVARLAADNVQTELFVTEFAGHATEVIREFDLEGYEGIGVLGGDGTVQEAVNGLMQRGHPEDCPLAMLPGGTGNSIHHQLGIQDLPESIDRIIERKTQAIDLLRVRTDNEEVFCINLVGWASVANIAARAENLRWLGRLRYSASALIEITLARRISGSLKLIDQELNDRFFLIIGCNTVQVGSGMRMAPQALTDDGLVDVVVVRNATRFQMLKLFQKVHSGKHVQLPFVESFQVPKFQLSFEQPYTVNLDGNVTPGQSRNFDVAVVPQAIQVFA